MGWINTKADKFEDYIVKDNINADIATMPEAIRTALADSHNTCFADANDISEKCIKKLGDVEMTTDTGAGSQEKLNKMIVRMVKTSAYIGCMHCNYYDACMGAANKKLYEKLGLEMRCECDGQA